MMNVVTNNTQNESLSENTCIGEGRLSIRCFDSGAKKVNEKMNSERKTMNGVTYKC